MTIVAVLQKFSWTAADVLSDLLMKQVGNKMWSSSQDIFWIEQQQTELFLSKSAWLCLVVWILLCAARQSKWSASLDNIELTKATTTLFIEDTKKETKHCIIYHWMNSSITSKITKADGHPKKLFLTMLVEEASPFTHQPKGMLKPF